jgi:hypothetical protein
MKRESESYYGEAHYVGSAPAGKRHKKRCSIICTEPGCGKQCIKIEGHTGKHVCNKNHEWRDD